MWGTTSSRRTPMFYPYALLKSLLLPVWVSPLGCSKCRPVPLQPHSGAHTSWHCTPKKYFHQTALFGSAVLLSLWYTSFHIAGWAGHTQGHPFLVMCFYLTFGL
jgi:hypothetical protein